MPVRGRFLAKEEANHIERGGKERTRRSMAGVADPGGDKTNAGILPLRLRSGSE